MHPPRDPRRSIPTAASAATLITMAMFIMKAALVMMAMLIITATLVTMAICLLAVQIPQRNASMATRPLAISFTLSVWSSASDFLAKPSGSNAPPG